MTNSDENFLSSYVKIRKLCEISFQEIHRSSFSSDYVEDYFVSFRQAMIFPRKIRGKGKNLAKELVVNLFLDWLSEGG